MQAKEPQGACNAGGSGSAAAAAAAAPAGAAGSAPAAAAAEAPARPRPQPRAGARSLNRSSNRSVSLTFREWLPGEALDSLTFTLLALGYWSQAFKVARFGQLTPAAAVALALGIWGALMSLAWRLFPGAGYMKHRTWVMFGVRLNLALIGAAVPLVLRRPHAMSLTDLLHVLASNGGWVPAVCVLSVFLPLPLRLHALLTLVAAGTIPVNAGRFCAESYMATPLQRSRMAMVFAVLQRLGLPARPLRARLARLSHAAACQASLVSLHGLGAVVLSTALAVEMRVRAMRRAAARRGRPPTNIEGWGSAGNRLVLYLVWGELLVCAVLWFFALFGEQAA